MSEFEPLSDADAAALYEILNPWGPAEDFYLPYIMTSRSVLDVGCGTGLLLRRARELGHTGRLTGIDPDPHALAIARQTLDIEWVQCRADQIPWVSEFDLVIMTGHAFQFLITDEEINSSLAAIRRSMPAGRLFICETRNPAARAWEDWGAAEPLEVTDRAGRTLHVSYEIESEEGDTVTFTESTRDLDGHLLRRDRATLRFLDETEISLRLGSSGFPTGLDFGNWDRSPVQPTSPELIFISTSD